MNIQPFNNIVLVKQLEGSDVKERESGILLPERQIGRFVKLEILAKGDLVTNMEIGDTVWANPMMEVVDSAQPNIGFINSKDILAKVIKI